MEAGRSFRWCPAPPNFLPGAPPRFPSLDFTAWLYFAPRTCFFLFHCVKAFLLPGGWGAARRWLAPARGAPRLLRPRPSSAARGGARLSWRGVPRPLRPAKRTLSTPRAPREPRRSSASRGPHETAAPTPHPGSARWGPRGLWRDGRPTRQAESLHPPTNKAHSAQAGPWRTGGWGGIRPAGHRSDHARACGYRAGVSRWGIAGAASCEQRGAPPRSVPPRSRAQAGRRAGLEAQPERPLTARGAKKETAST